MGHYDGYEHLRFAHDDGVLTITIDRPEAFNAANEVLHDEFVSVWGDVATDPDARAVVVTGAGKAFCAGADFEYIEQLLGDFDEIARMLRQANAVVYNMINLDKPIISAINGVAVGAGLSVALMADISIIAEGARLTDGHARLGLVAGDHAAILWPILCGMAKAKLYLLTGDFIDAREAERIGLVSMCVPPHELLPAAEQIARKLADGPQHAIRFTKRSLNGWLRQAGPIFEHSLALEMLTLLGADIREGVTALQEKRPPEFPSAGQSASFA